MSDDKPVRIIINHNPYHHGGPRRISDDKLEKESEAHVARMLQRRARGMVHAPTIKKTVWRPFKDASGEKRFYPTIKKVVDFGDEPKKGKRSLESGATTPTFDERDAQTRMLMESESRSLSAGGTDIDPMAF